MDDGVDLVFLYGPANELFVAAISHNQFRRIRHGPFETGCQIIDNDYFLTMIKKFQHHIAANVASTAPNGIVIMRHLLTGLIMYGEDHSSCISAR